VGRVGGCARERRLRRICRAARRPPRRRRRRGRAGLPPAPRARPPRAGRTGWPRVGLREAGPCERRAQPPYDELTDFGRVGGGYRLRAAPLHGPNAPPPRHPRPSRCGMLRPPPRPRSFRSQVVADDEIEALEIRGEVFRSIMSGARHPDAPLPCPARARARLLQRRTTLSAPHPLPPSVPLRIPYRTNECKATRVFRGVSGPSHERRISGRTRGLTRRPAAEVNRF